MAGIWERLLCLFVFFLRLKVSFFTLRGRGDNCFLGVQFDLPRPWYPALPIRMLNGSILFQSLTFNSRGHSCPTSIKTARCSPMWPNLLFPLSITQLLRARVVCIGATISQAVKNVKTKTLIFLSRWLRLVPRFPASSLPAQLTRGSCHCACSSSSPTLPASPAAWWTTPRTRTWRGRARMRWCVSSKRTGAALSQRRRSFELMASWTWIVCSTAWKVWNS